MSTVDASKIRASLSGSQSRQQSGSPGDNGTGNKRSTRRASTPLEIAQEWIDTHSNTRYLRAGFRRYQHGVWDELHDRVIDREVWRILEQKEAQHKVRSASLGTKSTILNILQARLFVPTPEIDAMDNLVNLRNGCYDLVAQTLIPHDQSFYLTTQLPFDFDPNATCPIWQAFLQTTFTLPQSKTHDPELSNFVQEAVGYSLTTSVMHHCTFWCFGEGANGKGVLFHALEKLGGTAAMPLNVGLLKREQYQLAMLAGRRIALCSESAATQNLVEDALIKALVGGDTMSVRQIRKEPFILHPKVKLWWSMNKLPTVADTSEGFWRRVLVIPFNRQFELKERILDLKEKIETELPGIFNWAMEGLRRLMQHGAFTIPQQVALATDQYRRESNPVALFIEEETKSTLGINTPSVTMYMAYKTYCQERGYRHLSDKNFKAEMERQKIWYGRSSSARFYQDVSLIV